MQRNINQLLVLNISCFVRKPWHRIAKLSGHTGILYYFRSNAGNEAKSANILKHTT